MLGIAFAAKEDEIHTQEGAKLFQLFAFWCSEAAQL